MIGRVIFVFCRKSPQLDGRNLSYNCTSSSTSSSFSSSWTQIPSSCCCTAVRHGAPPLHFQQQQSHILLIQPSHTYFLEQCNSILKLHGCRVLTLILLSCSPLLILLQLCSQCLPVALEAVQRKWDLIAQFCISVWNPVRAMGCQEGT